MAPTLIIVASIIIFPFLTYYATSSLFFRRANNNSTGKAPPTIPYFIPGLFHAVSFTQSGARKYFAELIKEYGTFAPFKVKAGPRSYVVLRDPTHIIRVLDAPEHLTANTVKVEMFDKLFGSPRAAEHLHQTEASDRNDHEVSTPEQLPFHIPDTTLASATEVYISKLSASMHDKMFQFDSWTRIEDLWSFLQLVLLRCTLDAFFGSALLKKYPKMIRDYLDFNAATEDFVHGMPRIMVSGATKPRDRLHQGMRSWLTATRAEIDETGEHNADSVEDDSVWDEKTGLRFICKHYNACKVDKVEEVNIRARAAEVLGIIHSTNTGLVSSTFWMTIEIMRKSHLTRDMIASVVRHLSPITHKYDVLGLAQEPLAKSLQTEVRRLRTGTCVVRTNKTDGFPLDKQWSLPNGATVAIFSYDISLNTDVWKKIQPQALKKPLEEFWAERFMVPEQKSRSKKHVGVDTSGSATQDLGDLVTRLVACDQYPGSRFISALQMATLAVLFAEFEVQLCDTEQVDAALPPIRESAYGTVKPLEKIAVRIRKRKT
ncbi:cytochrome P450 [Macroventuria anomochaeta]|uniref:Cytochrome P450 n=1 Tax=Macroventuria anomochaeta TaxID=301207 RepID=A0ACB6S538_9PLEO|nr:cytochrome P450 [Macroventuria anomochaeta]KAF2628478.1 cytochrome P450 [Macroventuria anomochaeta]